MEIKMEYNELKQKTREAIKRLDTTVYHFTLKDNGKIKLKELLDEIGIKSKINDKTFIITTNKNPNIFEKYLLDRLGYRICSLCNKLKYAPIRSIQNDCRFYSSTYGETFEHHYEPICKSCFQPILEQWKNQLINIKDRWVKREHPNWKKTETCYIDKDGNKYPLEDWTPNRMENQK